MKLKSTIAAVLMVASFSTFAVDLTLSPIYTVVDLVRTAVASSVGVVAAPFASSAMSSQQREQIQAIRNDAVDFLSGSEMSGRLESTISNLKSQEQLAGKTNTEIAAFIVTALN
jgi:hypothetical protein